MLAGYSRLAGKFTEAPNQAQVGTSFTNVPKHAVNAWTTYQVTSNLSVGGGGRYQDRRLLRSTVVAATATTPATVNNVYVPSYHTYDAVASYRLSSSLDLRMNVYNISDKLFYDSGRMWVPAAGRSVAFTTSVKF